MPKSFSFVAATTPLRRLNLASFKDPRVSVHPGDALPWFQSARLCVHPAYEDGFAYAPAEAMACGVPVLVSEDTELLLVPLRRGVIDRLRGRVPVSVAPRTRGHASSYATLSRLGRHPVRQRRALAHA